ncbi:hypothetical protein, partial [Pseudomonas syringae]|uniref:hypothetical protein n=1 Tax=Pseudomonas syringae TaxID=317 RepID=UPI001FEDF7AD
PSGVTPLRVGMPFMTLCVIFFREFPNEYLLLPDKFWRPQTNNAVGNCYWKQWVGHKKNTLDAIKWPLRNNSTA